MGCRVADRHTEAKRVINQSISVEEIPSYDILVLGSKYPPSSASTWAICFLSHTGYLYERKVNVPCGDEQFTIKVHYSAGDLYFELHGLYPLRIINRHR